MESKNKNTLIEAYCSFDISRDLNSRYYIDRTINFGVKQLNEIEKVKSLTHEINHIVNSIISSICKRNNSLLCRIGMSLYSLDGTYSESVYFEEAANESQAIEIFDIIGLFKNFNIKNPSIAQEIQKINPNIVRDDYKILVTSIKPLYMNQEFNCILKNKRLTGELKEIRKHFDDKVGIPNAFQDLSKEMDNLERNPNYLTKQRVMNKVYQYTKRQNY